MNLLVIYTDSNRLDECRVMDALQNEPLQGRPSIISDLCVAVHDVAKPDDAKAVEWLKKNFKSK